MKFLDDSMSRLPKGDVKLPQGVLRSQIRKAIYDTVTIAANESPIGSRVFFTDVTGKARYLTNLKMPNQLEGSVSFLIDHISVNAHCREAANKDALALIQEHSYMRLLVGDLEYWDGNMVDLTGKVTQETTVADSHFSQYGWARMCGLKLRGYQRIPIRPVRSFRVDWECAGMSAAEITAATPVADSKLAFRLALQGYLRRPVQG